MRCVFGVLLIINWRLFGFLIWILVQILIIHRVIFQECSFFDLFHCDYFHNCEDNQLIYRELFSNSFKEKKLLGKWCCRKKYKLWSYFVQSDRNFWDKGINNPSIIKRINSCKFRIGSNSRDLVSFWSIFEWMETIKQGLGVSLPR